METSDKQNIKQTITGYIFALGATAIWSGNFIIACGLDGKIPPFTLSFYRWFVAVVIFLPFGIKTLISQWDILKKNMAYLSITALCGITMFNTLVYFAGHTTSAINLSLISITSPIFIVIFFRLFFDEKITLCKGVGILLVATGVVLLITRGSIAILLDISFAMGDVWMLLASMLFAIYCILLKHKPEGLNVLTLQLSTFILGLIFLFPFFMWESTTITVLRFDSTVVFTIFYLGVFASLSAFVLWNKAVEAVGPSEAGMIYYTIPLFSGCLAYLFLDEAVTIIHFFSALLIVLGIFTANYEQNLQ